jgi:hypothetical protein
MAELTYQVAGQTVTLDVCKINRLDHRAVYDPSEVDLLYTHFYIDVTCVFNQLATASIPNQAAPPQFVPNPRDGNNVPVAAGNDPMTSVAGLRQFLMTPRGLLTLTVGNITICSSPRNIVLLGGGGRKVPLVDAKNGPRPVSLECQSVHGTKSIICRYVIETWIQESDPSTGAMLSHRWTMAQTVDVDNYMLTAKHIEGLVIFSSATLALENFPMDDFRNKFGHPVKDGLMRKNIMVKAEADGLQVRYSFDDQEKVTNLSPNYGIVDVDAWGENNTNWTQLTNPVTSAEYTVAVTGIRTITRKQLAKAAINIFAGIAGSIALKCPGYHYGLRMDYVNRYCDLTVGMTTSAYGPLGGLATLIFADTVTGLGNIDYAEKIGDIGDTAIGPNIAPPGSNKTRGTFLERVVVQALSTAGAVPAVPPVPGSPMDVQ